jgi:hypothetical protein
MRSWSKGKRHGRTNKPRVVELRISRCRSFSMVIKEGSPLQFPLLADYRLLYSTLLTVMEFNWEVGYSS